MLFIKDATRREIPDIDGDASIWSTSSCIAVMCRPDVDGDTDITVGLAKEVDPGTSPLFEGQLNTPSRRIALEIVPGDKILELPVPDGRTRARVWTDGLRCAEKVIIGIG